MFGDYVTVKVGGGLVSHGVFWLTIARTSNV